MQKRWKARRNTTPRRNTYVESKCFASALQFTVQRQELGCVTLVSEDLQYRFFPMKIDLEYERSYILFEEMPSAEFDMEINFVISL